MPSRIANDLLSVPSAWTSTRPSVSTPSTSNRISRTRRPWIARTLDATGPTRAPSARARAGARPRRRGGDAVDDDDRRDLALFHDVQRFGGERAGRNRDGAARHHVRRLQRQEIAVPRHVAAQVAVGDDAEQAPLVVDHAGHAELLARHLVDHVAHRRRRAAPPGQCLPACIRLSTRISFLPSFPPGCRFAKSSS